MDQRKKDVRYRCSGADESVLDRNRRNHTALTLALAIPASVFGLVLAYHFGIAIIDGFEWLLHIGVVLGANPFGWSL